MDRIDSSPPWVSRENACVPGVAQSFDGRTRSAELAGDWPSASSTSCDHEQGIILVSSSSLHRQLVRKLTHLLCVQRCAPRSLVSSTAVPVDHTKMKISLSALTEHTCFDVEPVLTHSCKRPSPRPHPPSPAQPRPTPPRRPQPHMNRYHLHILHPRLRQPRTPPRIR